MMPGATSGRSGGGLPRVIPVRPSIGAGRSRDWPFHSRSWAREGMGLAAALSPEARVVRVRWPSGMRTICADPRIAAGHVDPVGVRCGQCSSVERMHSALKDSRGGRDAYGQALAVCSGVSDSASRPPLQESIGPSWRHRMICTLDYPKEEQIEHIRDQRSDCAIL